MGCRSADRAEVQPIGLRGRAGKRPFLFRRRIQGRPDDVR